MLLLKNNVAKETAGLLFILKLLFLMCLIKSIFFFYNYNISNGWSLNSGNVWPVILWSLLYDAFILCLVNAPLFIFLILPGKVLRSNIFAKGLAIITAMLNSLVILLNTIDIFYYRFHLQRADADLLYVLRNPFTNATVAPILIMIAGISLFVTICLLVYKSVMQLRYKARLSNHVTFINLLPIVFAGIFLLSGTQKLLPTFALTKIEAGQLPLVQNSLHSFIYSIYRRNDLILPAKNYMPGKEQEAILSIHKKNIVTTSPKNIVLFIMESVPAEFFDSNSPHKVTMPFLDSLVTKSKFFSNAFSYSYNSNKGITAMLAGLPTIIDIPLYHSNFTALKRTSIGTVLAAKQYQSAFFIGDNYDDFGFAKCCKWLGIQQYYCMQDIPGYKEKEKHSMGLHDEYVLNFMQQKLAVLKEPFLSIQYNISTHYPYNLPSTLQKIHPANKTDHQKAMQYYNDCLQSFFREAVNKAWYKNSVFIFCSDHWVEPGDVNTRIDEVNSFRIPLFVFEPGKAGDRVLATVSQLDILNSILSFAGVRDSFISYGQNLADTPAANRTIFTKMNGAIYQAIDSRFVLGFNAIEGKSVYCYNYKTDPGKKRNLLLEGSNLAITTMELQMKAFLQTASSHYRN